MKATPSTENLEGLIQTIREEGIEEANRQSEQIIAAARQRASGIVRAAEERAEQLAEESRQRIARQDESTRRSLQQAGRDLVLSVRAALVERLERLVEQECGGVMNGEALEHLILGVAQSWMKQAHGGAVEVQVNEKDRERLAATFLSRLQEALKEGVELQPHPDIRHGFRIGWRDSTMVYDFTDEAVAAALSELVNPRLVELFAAPADAAEAEGGVTDG